MDGVSLGRCGSTGPAVFMRYLATDDRIGGTAAFPRRVPVRGKAASAQRKRSWWQWN